MVYLYIRKVYFQSIHLTFVAVFTDTTFKAINLADLQNSSYQYLHFMVDQLTHSGKQIKRLSKPIQAILLNLNLHTIIIQAY